MHARVTGLGAVTAWGQGLEATWQGALQGRIATGPPRALSVPELPEVHVGESLGPLAPEIDRARALARLAISEALADAGWSPASCIRPDTALVVATTKGGIGLAQHVLEGSAPPVVLRDFPLSELAAGLARELGLTGPVQTVSVACASGTSALGQGLRLIRQGRARRVLVVGVDALCEFIVLGFASLRALARGPARPFDADRDGLVPGQAAAALCLEADTAQPSAARALLTGFGASDDATHITGPARDGAGLARAMTAALADAGATPADIAAISAHGTATRFNDAMEDAALRSVFGPCTPPVHSLKGGIGHTMGAAGLVEAAVAVRALELKLWPPTAGLLTLDPELTADVVTGAPRPLAGRAIISSSSGFSGINSAVVLCQTP